MLPQSMRDPQRVLDKKGVEELMLRLAKEQPDLYPKVAQFLSEQGAKMAYRRGETFRLSDFKPTASREAILTNLRKDVDRLNNSGLAGKELNQARMDLFGKYSEQLADATSKEALAARNNIAMTVLSGARGKKPQLRDLIASPGFYTDYEGNPIPWFIERSFSEGLSTADFLAGAYAARGAVTESKKAVAKGGFLAKTFARTNARNAITMKDCGTTNGIDLPPDEKDLRGRVLQRPAGGVESGAVIDRGVFNSIQKAGKPVIVRSPLTCEAPQGICAKCFGVTAEGKFPSVGDHVGMTSANAIGEPMAQGALNQKHVTSASGPGAEYAGLDYLTQFTESPEEFKNRTVVSPKEGVITDIRPAPQGGQYVLVGNEEVYVPADRTLVVKKGDELEAGDSLTDGLTDPEDVVNLKGLGEGRRYYADKLGEIAAASGAGMDRRNFEVLARSAVNHVELDDPEEEGYLPSDVVAYNEYQTRRSLPEDLEESEPDAAVGKYLQTPALHYTVGTRITNQVAKRLKDTGFGKVTVSKQEPGFRPVMMRLQQAASFDDDWLARLGGSYLSKNLEDSKTRALDTNIEQNLHPVPRLAAGVGYADKLDTGAGF